jgi:Integrase core domain
MQDEFHSVAFRKRLYTSLEQLQSDVDAWIAEYNESRPHSGKYCFGKTPMETFAAPSTSPMKSNSIALCPYLHRKRFYPTAKVPA